MASLSGALAWSIPVPVARLGAHLEAYAKLHADEGVIHNLRLCHRFGSQATITRLPVELLLRIEDYLMQDERRQQLIEWGREYKCFEDRCQNIDHLSDEEQREQYLSFHDEFGCECGDGPSSKALRRIRDGKNLTVRQRADLSQMLIDDGDFDWVELHESVVEDWNIRIAWFSGHNYGALAKYKILRKHFGLETFVTHTQPQKGKPGQNKSGGVYRSTRAYIVLPCDKFDHAIERPEHPGDEYPRSAEAGFEVPVAVPQSISKADVTKFARVCRMLDLTPLDATTTAPVIAALPADRESPTEGEETKDSENDSEDKKSSEYLPKLRLLLRSWLHFEG